jgi:hypothetical protein
LTEPVLSLIFIAKKLRDAKTLEAILSAAGIDYHVEPDEYLGGFVFKTKRIGAFFYVAEENREAATGVMIKNGYVPADRDNPEAGDPEPTEPEAH